MFGYLSCFYSESAARVKKKSKLKPECSIDSTTPASGSVKEMQDNAVQVTEEKVSRRFLRAEFARLLFFICLSKYF